MSIGISGNTVWVTPSNLKDYDIHSAFNDLKSIDWHYTNSIKNVKIGDIVYIYVSQPECAMRYKCEVTKINIPYLEIDDRHYNKNIKANGNTYFELKLIKKFDKDLLSLEELRKNGIKKNIQGPQRLHKETTKFIERNENR